MGISVPTEFVHWHEHSGIDLPVRGSRRHRGAVSMNERQPLLIKAASEAAEPHHVVVTAIVEDNSLRRKNPSGSIA